MADKVYVLETNENGTPKAAASASGLTGPAWWTLEVVGDTMGQAGMDEYALSTELGKPLPEGHRYEYFAMFVPMLLAMEPLLAEQGAKIEALEARLATLEGEPAA